MNQIASIKRVYKHIFIYHLLHKNRHAIFGTTFQSGTKT